MCNCRRLANVLTVVVKVVSEKLNTRDCGGHDLRILEMTRKEDKSDVADILSSAEAGDAANLQGWLSIGVQDLGRILYTRLSPGVDELLQEHPAKNFVSLFFECCAEDHGDPVSTRDDVNSLVIAIIDGHDFRRSRWLLLSCRILRRFFQLSLQRKGSLEGCSHGIAFQKRD